MAAAKPNQLSTLIANMFSAGLLDDQFRQLEILQDEGNPDFVANVVTLFCEEGERIIGDLANQLDQPCVDYDKVDTFVDQLWGSSLYVGAQRVKNTCIQFHECCQEKSKVGCLKTLDSLRNDFYDLCSMFIPLGDSAGAACPKL